MDFTKLDSRAKAEAGTAMNILDAWTGEPIMDGDKHCRVIVRGTASKTMQAKMRAKAKAAMQSKKDKGDKAEDEEARVMEDVHNQLCEGAAPFIIGFENVNKGDKPATAEDAEWFLDLTFPEMGVKQDDDGNDVTRVTKVTDEKTGKVSEVETPVFEMTNNPFAKQIGDFAGKQANRMGNAKKG